MLSVVKKRYFVPRIGEFIICHKNKLWRDNACIFAGDTYDTTVSTLTTYIAKLLREELGVERGRVDLKTYETAN